MIVLYDETRVINVFDDLPDGIYVMTVSKESFHGIGEIEVQVESGGIMIIGVSFNDDFNDDFDIYDGQVPSNIDSLLGMLHWKYGEYKFEINGEEYLVRYSC